MIVSVYPNLLTQGREVLGWSVAPDELLVRGLCIGSSSAL
jgi:hypothetical protein